MKGEQKTLRTSCESGEIANPKARCLEAPDMGTASGCGDGRVDAPEECDPAASPVGCTSVGHSCTTMCTCVDQCGDGVKQPGESCEKNSECASIAPDVFCRGCRCAGTVAPARIDDGSLPDVSPADVPDAVTRRILDIRFAEMVRTADRVRVELTVGGVWTAALVGTKACMVVLEPAEVARICFELTSTGGKLELLQPGSAPRDLAAEITAAGGMYNGLGGSPLLKMWFPPAVSLPMTPSSRVFWQIEYMGKIVDRAPDSGSMSWAEVVGRD